MDGKTSTGAATTPPPPALRRGLRVSATHRRLIRLVRRRPVLCASGLAVLHLVFALLTFDPTPHTGGDNGAYVTLGRSLLEHGTYSELWEPGTPPHTKYPPVFPALLALAMAVGLQSWPQLKLVVIALSTVGVAFSFLWLRARRRAALALGIGLLLAMAPGVLREGRWLLSDVPFWAFTMLAIWGFERMRTAPSGSAREVRSANVAFSAGVAGTVLAYMTRSAGLPLLLAALTRLALHRQWRRLGILTLGAGVPALLWWFRSQRFGTAGYVSEFWLVNPYVPAAGRIGAGDLLQRALQNVGKYVNVHLPMLLTQQVGLLLTVISTLIFILAVAGWARRVRRPSTAELFVPLYLSLILIWPALWSGERFLLPLLPFLLFYAGESLFRLLTRVAPRWSTPALAGAGTLLLLLAAPGLIHAVHRGTECSMRYVDGHRYPCLPSFLYDEFFDAAAVAGAALPEHAVVVNRKPRLFYVLAGGVQGINHPMTRDWRTFFETAEAAGARYVVYDELDAMAEFYLRPILLRKARGFCVMRAWRGGTLLFGILPDAAEVPDLQPEDLDEDGSVLFALCDDEYWRNEEARTRFEGM
jgi:hypothetical protein